MRRSFDVGSFRGALGFGWAGACVAWAIATERWWWFGPALLFLLAGASMARWFRRPDDLG